MTQTPSLKLKLFLLAVRVVRAIPLLHKATWQSRKLYNKLLRLWRVHKPVGSVAPLLENAIRTRTPYAAGKMGSTEAQALQLFFGRERAAQKGQPRKPYSPYIHHTLFLNSGVFPQDAAFYDRFCKAYLESVSACDALVAWDVAGESEVLATYARQATLVRLYSLESYLSETPWTAALQGRKVLVISPFAASITKQYARRTELWDNPQVLPAFDLLTLQAPLSAGLVQPKDADWFAALDRMKSEMDVQDYDVALIGAGAFSLPLAAHAKQKGKVGIHLGGSLQLLFGVYGNRALTNGLISPHIKESWVRPAPSETPENFKANENGCYW